MTDETTPGASPAPTPAAAPPPTQTINIQAPAAAPSNGLAVAALVLGILALLFFWIPFLGWIPVILGLVFGLVALQRPESRGMALAGVICSAIALAIKVLFWIALAGIIGAAASAGHHGF